MTLIVQIVLGLLLLVGLATIIMSSKNWHWTQLTLVLCIFFAGVGFLFLGAETVRVHRNLRAGLPKLQQRITSFDQQNDELLNGSSDKPGILELDHRLQIVTRERGRVWRGVMPAGQVDPKTGRIAISIAKPQPHGLEKGAIIYAFATGNPDMGDPSNGMQYLGEFRVLEIQADGATLEPILLIDNRMGKRLAGSEGPWSLYETMPIDRHRLFAGYTEEQLEGMLPRESVEEYLRHGSPANADDDEWHVIGLDADDQRVGVDNIDQAVKKLYNRSLRDYAYIFSKLAGEKVKLLAKQEAASEDIARLVKSLTGAEETGQFRQKQIDALGNDLTGMKADLTAIESHRNAVLGQLRHFQQRIDDYLADNSVRAKALADRQLGMLNYINSSAPAPNRTILLGR